MTVIAESEPVYLFQMGKVGSLSLHSTLTGCLNNPVIHAHCFEEMAADEQHLLQTRCRQGLPVSVITPIREPLSRNVSAFFQTFKRDTGFELSDRRWSVSEILDLFLQRYPHEESLDWFDESFQPALGLDVYAQPFPRQKKWAVYQKDSVRILIYRIDLGRQEQLAVISEFLGRRIEEWVLANRAEDKDYAELYREFCTKARLPEAYLTRLSDSRFFRHFWSEAEIQHYLGKWR